MRHSMERLFLDHPESVGETYLEHMRFAGGFAVSLLAAGFAALIHAFLPFMFEKTASGVIERLHRRMHNRSSAR